MSSCALRLIVSTIFCQAASLSAQDLHPLDSFGVKTAAYDMVRGRALCIGQSHETCELAAGVWRPRPVPALDIWPERLVYDSGTMSMFLVGLQPPNVVLRRFDGVAWRSVATATTPPARGAFSVAYDIGRGELVLFGGLAGSQDLADTWVFDGTDWHQRVPVVSPAPRDSAVMSYDFARSRTVLFGGFGGGLITSSPIQDTWEWDGTTWQQFLPATQPSARGVGVMAYDIARQRTVMFGGNDGTWRNDVWEWDGVDWTQVTPIGPNPSARNGASLFFDWGRNEVMLVGGNQNGYLQGAWTWNGTRWQPHAAASGARSRAFLFVDPASREPLVLNHELAPTVTRRWNGLDWTVLAGTTPPTRWNGATCSSATTAYLYGGLLQTLTQGTDLWGFDGTQWTLLSAAGPQGRLGTAMAFDQVRGELVLFGGHPGNGPTNGDTWVFDGVQWALRPMLNGPVDRANAHATFDPTRGHIVMFGGYSSTAGYLNDTWEWDGAQWLAVATTIVPPQATGLAFDVERSRCVLINDEITTMHAWTLEATGWMPLPLGAVDQLSIVGGVREVVGYPYSRGLLLRDSRQLASLSSAQAAIADYGAACTAQAPRLAASRWSRLGTSDFAFEMIAAPANSLAALMGSTQSANLSLGGCSLLIAPSPATGLLATSATGFASHPLPLPLDVAFLGLNLFFQAAALDPLAPQGFTLSAGLRLTLGN